MLLLGSVLSMNRSFGFPGHEVSAHRTTRRHTFDIIVPVFKLFNNNVFLKAAT